MGRTRVVVIRKDIYYMRKELQKRIISALQDGQVGAGRAIKMCRVEGVSPSEFGRIIKEGLRVYSLTISDKPFVLTELYGSEIKFETKREFLCDMSSVVGKSKKTINWKKKTVTRKVG